MVFHINYTVSSCNIRSVLDSAHPLFRSNVILKSVVTQCESWLGITLIIISILIWLETLSMYTREDTVYGVADSEILCAF